MNRLTAVALASMMMASVAVFAEGGARSGDMYNPREEVEYSNHAAMERRDERLQQIQLQQYQQQQHLEQQRLMNQQDMYNQTHQRKKLPDSSILQE